MNNYEFSCNRYEFSLSGIIETHDDDSQAYDRAKQIENGLKALFPWLTIKISWKCVYRS